MLQLRNVDDDASVCNNMLLWYTRSVTRFYMPFQAHRKSSLSSEPNFDVIIVFCTWMLRIFDIFQSAYRPMHSCETVFVRVEYDN